MGGGGVEPENVGVGVPLVIVLDLKLPRAR